MAYPSGFSKRFLGAFWNDFFLGIEPATRVLRFGSKTIIQVKRANKT